MSSETEINTDPGAAENKKNSLNKPYFSTTDIIVISMFGALGIVIGILGNVLHGMSGLVFIGPFLLHTLLPGIVVFACAATVRKAGTATMYSLIASLIAMPLMGAPLFIVMYVAQGLLIDGFTLALQDRMWSRWGIIPAATVYGIAGILILYYVVLGASGLVFPEWVIIPSIPLNLVFAIPAALVGLKIGQRAVTTLGG
jgi:hypothetical protein